MQGADLREQVKFGAISCHLSVRVLKAYMAFGRAISSLGIHLHDIGENSTFAVFDINRPLKAEGILGWSPFQIIGLNIEWHRRLSRMETRHPSYYPEYANQHHSRADPA
jgi:hypothetical protein